MTALDSMNRWYYFYVLFTQILIDHLCGSRQAVASRADTGDDVVTASVTSIGRHDGDISDESLGKLAAELLGLLQTARDAVSPHGAQAVVGRAGVGLARVAFGHLDEEDTTLDGVDQDQAGLEAGVRVPRADEVNNATAEEVVVLGVGVEVGNLADTLAGRVLGHRGNVVNAHAGAVVGLVDQVAENILVVVNAAVGSLVETGLLGSLEVTNVPDEGDCRMLLASIPHE